MNNKEQQEQYADLMNKVGDLLNGKDLALVIPVLTAQLGNAGIATDTGFDEFIEYVARTIHLRFVVYELQNTSTETMH
jgi:hypothetical protein